MNYKQHKRELSKHAVKIIISLVAAVLAISVFLSMPYVISWFKNKLEVNQPAHLTNFVATLEYQNGSGWTELASGTAIKVAPDVIDDIKFRVFHEGYSQCYLRISVFGGFKNKVTGTYLPQPDNFLTLSGDSNWIFKNGYLYYKKKLEKHSDPAQITSSSNPIKINVNWNAVAEVSNYQEYESEIYLLVDMVQPDRIQAHWGLSAIPTA